MNTMNPEDIALAELATAVEEFLEAYQYTGHIQNHLSHNPLTPYLQTLEMALNHYQRTCMINGGTYA